MPSHLCWLKAWYARYAPAELEAHWSKPYVRFLTFHNKFSHYERVLE